MLDIKQMETENQVLATTERGALNTERNNLLIKDNEADKEDPATNQ